MANFDKNSWYQVTVASHPGQDLDGTPVYDEGRGAVFFQITNTSLSQHQWQVFLYNTSNYVFRTKASGAGSFLSAAFAATEETPGKTIPQMRVSAIADSSMFWQIGPWGDGTFYMTNLANGSAWHLLNKPNSLMAMSSNITAPQNGQRFSFTSIGKINSSPFSDVVVCELALFVVLFLTEIATDPICHSYQDRHVVDQLFNITNVTNVNVSHNSRTL
jgi:hypothetical protein